MKINQQIKLGFNPINQKYLRLDKKGIKIRKTCIQLGKGRALERDHIKENVSLKRTSPRT